MYTRRGRRIECTRSRRWSWCAASGPPRGATLCRQASCRGGGDRQRPGSVAGDHVPPRAPDKPRALEGRAVNAKRGPYFGPRSFLRGHLHGVRPAAGRLLHLTGPATASIQSVPSIFNRSGFGPSGETHPQRNGTYHLPNTARRFASGCVAGLKVCSPRSAATATNPTSDVTNTKGSSAPMSRLNISAVCKCSASPA